MAKNPTPEEASKELPAADGKLQSDTLPHCGIIMPISDTTGYDSGHWLQVRQLIIRAAEKAGFTATMVSENEGQDMIHASIIKNIYHNPVVVCDVSSLNPNVMLELGLRMATKKPLVLVFDSADTYPFDIKNFIYEGYPKGLHYFKVEKFVENLAIKIKQVYETEKQGNYQPYLSHFNDVVIETSRLDVNTQTVTDALVGLARDVKGLKADFQSVQPIFNMQDIRGQLTMSDAHALSPREISHLDVQINYAAGKQPALEDKSIVFNTLMTSLENNFMTASGAPTLVEARRRFQFVYSTLVDYITVELNKLYAST